MGTLIEICHDQIAFAALLDECDAEPSIEAQQALELWFAELQASSKDKIDHYCAFVRELTLRAAARKEEAERLQKRADIDTNLAKELKERLKVYLQIQGIKRVETHRYKVTVAGNGGLVPLKIDVDPNKLPKEFQKWTVEPDNAKLRDALECGEVVEGVSLGVRGSHLRIS